MPRSYSFDHFTALPPSLASDAPRHSIQRSGSLPGPKIGSHVETETESIFHARQMLNELEGLMRKRGPRKSKRPAAKRPASKGRRTVRRPAVAAQRRRTKRKSK
jgi:hypothetical protein